MRRAFVVFKFSFTLFLSCVLYNSKAQVTVSVKWLQHTPPISSDTIYYATEKKLTWPDFKGKPERNSDAIAITSSGFGYTAGVKYRNGKTDINIIVYCYFSKSNSWVLKGRESDYALTHEQHHFDISYIAASLFMQKLKTAQLTWNNYNQMLEKIYMESRTVLQKMQNEYDSATSNGRLPAIQEKWNKKIETQLKEITTN
jgi:hypothetical protein